MKWFLTVFGLTVVLGVVGFFGSATICRSLQDSQPDLPQLKAEYKYLIEGLKLHRGLEMITRNAKEQALWAYVGGGVGTSWGISLGLLIVAAARRKKRIPAAIVGKPQTKVRLSLAILVPSLLFLALPPVGLILAHLYSAMQPPEHISLDLGQGVTMELTRIPAGKFMMGSPESETGRRDDEGPQREVTISKPFYMGVYEVTRLQWYTVMGSHARMSRPIVNVHDKPVNSITWNEANEFCEKLSKKTGKNVRLPTEAQWEYACRAGSTTRYYFGDLGFDVIFSYAWLCTSDKRVSRVPGPQHVGQKLPNRWGLYDMYGNISEWCRDWYAKDYYANASNVDPENTTETNARVHRGGGFGHGSLENYRSAKRNRFHPTKSIYEVLGFRVVVEAE